MSQITAIIEYYYGYIKKYLPIPLLISSLIKTSDRSITLWLTMLITLSVIDRGTYKVNYRVLSEEAPFIHLMRWLILVVDNLLLLGTSTCLIYLYLDVIALIPFITSILIAILSLFSLLFEIGLVIIFSKYPHMGDNHRFFFMQLTNIIDGYPTAYIN